ncbi:hypothetical protein BJ742DRAFT_774039 [Cladochytrium replicatum]|nr:hypothetical protein BJ742DRAFT_774039 [Cladochytrium replicatum]
MARIDIPSEVIHQILILLRTWGNNPAFGKKWSNPGTAMVIATENGRFNLLEWWKSSRLPCVYTSLGLTRAISIGDVDVLEWWRSSGMPFKWKGFVMDIASTMVRTDLLEWW